MFISDTLLIGKMECGNMTQLEQLEVILASGGQEFGKVVDRDGTIIIQICLYNDILVFRFNHDGTIKVIEEC